MIGQYGFVGHLLWTHEKSRAVVMFLTSRVAAATYSRSNASLDGIFLLDILKDKVNVVPHRKFNTALIAPLAICVIYLYFL